MMEMIELTVKDAVLQALEQARGTRLSGGRLAEQLGVSRAAVHKAIAANASRPTFSTCARAALPLTP